MFAFIDLILAMGFAWMFSGMALLVINRNQNSTPAWPGSLLILVFGLTLLDNFIKPEMLPDIIVKSLFIISRNSYFLIGPFLLFYTRSLLSQKKMGKGALLHLLPFILMAIQAGLNPTILIPDHEIPDTSIVQGLFSSPWIYRDILSILSRGGYCFFVFKIIRNHAKKVPDFYSRKTIRNTLSWLFYLVGFYLLLFLIYFVILMLPPGSYVLHTITTSFVRLAPSLLFILLFSLFAQNQRVPEDKQTKETRGEITLSKDEKYRKSNLSSKETQMLFEQLNSYITESELFLDPDLTLDSLAVQMGESRHRLSEVINRESGSNFYSYINGFRLKEFITAVEENKYPHFTILAVALECGFKSPSAFYALFKKSIGKTPKEYMKEMACNERKLCI